MRKPKATFGIIVILAMLAGVISSHTIVRNGNALAGFLKVFKTPIEFYGKVVDQHGDPVVGAAVMLLPFDNMGESSRSKMMLRSDEQGGFSVKGLTGLAMGVQVTKDGYMTLPDLGLEKRASSRRIEYGLDGTGGKRFKNPSRPTLFTLIKIGPLEPMAYTEQKRWGLLVDGTPRKIALDSNDGIGPHQIEFRFMSDWGKLPADNEINSKRYDWSFEARIPGGGFLINASEYNFEAPPDGYQESIKIAYPSTMDPAQWKRSEFGRYFVRFPDGSYGRLRFSIDGASDSNDGALSMTSWLNLTPGSRNLASKHWDSSIVSE